MMASILHIVYTINWAKKAQGTWVGSNQHHSDQKSLDYRVRLTDS